MSKICPLAIIPLTLTAVIASPGAERGRVQRTVASIPLSFERNIGQGPRGYDFIARAPGRLLAFAGTEVTLLGDHTPVRLRLLGPSSRARLEAVDPLPGKSHYFVGSDPGRWRTNVAQYRRLRISDVYAGVNITFYGRGDRLEYDFEVDPGGDPTAIQMQIEGAGPLDMDADGDLLIPSGTGKARLHAPLIYQRAGSELRPVRGVHKLTGGNLLRFELEKYDPRLPLVMDPVLSYSTTFAGGRPTFTDVALDKAGNTYLTGCAASGMPLVTPYLEEFTTDRDAIVAKISADGATLLYSTYIGGGCASSIALDALGNVLLAGTTTNRYFPLRNPAFTKQGGSFLTKLNAEGNALIYSTYLGGDLTDAVTGMTIDKDGAAYVTGRTRAESYPATVSLPSLASPDSEQPSVRSGFVAKFSPNGSTLYSAPLGAGVSPAAIAVDAQGAAYVAGALCGERYPVTADGTADVPAGCDAFAVKVRPDASGYASSYTFGGTAWDGVSQIALDSAGNAYVSGVTFSADFPVSPGAPQRELRGEWDAFVAKLAPGGGLAYATYLGGTREETPVALAVDGAGRASVAGVTTSADFPLADALRPKRNGAPQPLHLSDNGGETWMSVFSQGEQSGAFYPWRGSVMALAATSNPRIVYSADRFNVYRSNDGGATWNTAGSRPNQWQIRTLVAHPSNPDALYVVALPAPTSTSASSSVWFSSDGGATFTTRGNFNTAAADRLSLWISASDADVAYALIRRRIDPQLFRSDDGGQTWERAAALPELFQSMVLDPTTSARLYAGTDSGLYVTTDSGATWRLIDGTQCPVDRIGPCQFQELYTDPSNPSAILFTRRSGREYGYTNQQLQIYRSADGGTTWTAATTPVVADATAFAIDPANPSVWYVAFTGSNGVYRSSDRGATWSPLSPAAPFWTDTISAIAVLPLQPSRTLLATNAGSEGFLATLAADGGSWVQSTWLGGAGADTVTGLRADEQGWYVIVNNALQRLETSNGGCDLTVTPAETTLHFLGSFARIQVRTGSSCAWRAESTAPWLAVVSPSSGSGWGNIEIVAGPNPSTSARVERLTINGQTLTVIQPGGPPCTPTPDVYRIIPAARTTDGAAVNFTAGCQWSVAKEASWVSLGSTFPGVTSSIVPYTAEANTSKTARQAVLTFTARGAAVNATHTILQSAPNCSVHATASTDRVPASGGLVTLRLETNPQDCAAWVADSGVGWAAPAPGPVPSPGATALPGAPNWGIGDGAVTFMFQPNTSPTERQARLQIAGDGVLVTQAGVNCAYTFKPASQMIDAAAFDSLVTIDAPTGCPWTAVSNSTWLRITSVTPTRGASFASGPTGNGRVYFTAEANTTGAERTGMITVGGQTFRLNQAP